MHLESLTQHAKGKHTYISVGEGACLGSQVAKTIIGWGKLIHCLRAIFFALTYLVIPVKLYIPKLPEGLCKLLTFGVRPV